MTNFIAIREQSLAIGGGGPGVRARAAIFWAPIWGRLKLFGPAFMGGLQFWVPLGDARVSVTKKKTA